MAGPQEGAGGRLRGLLHRGILTAAPLWPYYLLVYALALFHLAEVHWLDPAATRLVAGLDGSGVEVFAAIEAPFYHALDAVWTPERVAGVSAYYLLGFVALLWWTPHIVAAMGDRVRLRAVLLTYPLLYLLALPGYLLVPQLNPYIALELADPFSPLAVGLEESYYLFTTANNTFPSLHVAFTAALTVHLMRSSWELLRGAAAVHGVLLVVSVVYVRVHWVGDVIGGLLVAWIALWLAERAARRQGPLGGLARRLDRLGHRGAGRLTARLRER